MGAIISIVTKSGTNNFHGGAFYDGRNDKLNATDYFNTLNHIKKDVLRRNDWGYNIGGPVVKDKLFFFFSQEWNHEQRGAARSGDVPTAAEKTGDFSQQRTDVSNSGALCDPAPALRDSNNNIIGGPYTNISQVPSGGLSAAGQAYLSMFPDPNVAKS